MSPIALVMLALFVGANAALGVAVWVLSGALRQAAEMMALAVAVHNAALGDQQEPSA